MKKTAFTALIAAAALAATPALAAECPHQAEREASADAAGARAVRVEAGAGDLRVEGRDALARVEARGTACASDADVLEGIRVRATREGDVVVVKVEIPDRGMSWGRGRHAGLDLVVALPRKLPVTVEDGSGAAQIARVGTLKVRDGSGALVITDVDGDVGIEDGSGSIEVKRVAGDVRVSDGSGSVDVQDVEGSVTVDEDGSGSIDVSGVKGDFTVAHDGSGGIAHRQVAGQVRIPDRRHR